MNYSLVIIDMQPYFPAACNLRTVGAVIREIKQARRNNRPIFVVELVGVCRVEFGHTHERILEALEGYDKWYQVDKYTTDGSGVLLTPEAEKNEDGPSIPEITRCKRVRIVGVNTDCCVKATALGLQYAGYQVQVVSDACHSTYNHLGGLESMRRKGCHMLRLAQA